MQQFYNSATWTSKHTSIALKRSLSTSARYLWEWLLTQSKNVYTEVEFDLKRFNKWIASRREQGAYDPRTLKRAAEELVEKEIVQDLAEGRFKWNWKRWKLAQIFCKPRPVLARNAEKAGSNAISVDDEVNTTNSTSLLDLPEEVIERVEANVELIQEAGIEDFSASIGAELLAKTDPIDMKAAIAYLKAYTSPIRKPAAFLYDCIADQWWKTEEEALSSQSALIQIAKDMEKKRLHL